LSEYGNEEHAAYLQLHRIKEFDLVVVNLYPFSSVAADAKSLENARKNIDIGGVALIEAAAKNFLRVVVLVEPSDYASLIAHMKKNNGSVDLKLRIQLAKKAFKYISSYLGSISNYYAGLSDNVIQTFYGVEKHEWKERLQERLHKDS
jgi:phosphoribosylaminoimidazolecarboxamide formyltransferase/IMP cyclohydrolase